MFEKINLTGPKIIQDKTRLLSGSGKLTWQDQRLYKITQDFLEGVEN